MQSNCYLYVHMYVLIHRSQSPLVEDSYLNVCFAARSPQACRCTTSRPLSAATLLLSFNVI